MNDELENWHRWFAWYPVVVNTKQDASFRYGWLGFVARKLCATGGKNKDYYFKYNEIDEVDTRE